MRHQHHSKGRRASRAAVAPVSASEWGDPTGSSAAVIGAEDGDEEILCPLCIEPLDETEVRFKPCPCGYQVCLFCYERIKLELNGLCPSCRTAYGSPQEASPRQSSPSSSGSSNTAASTSDRSHTLSGGAVPVQGSDSLEPSQLPEPAPALPRTPSLQELPDASPAPQRALENASSEEPGLLEIANRGQAAAPGGIPSEASGEQASSSNSSRAYHAEAPGSSNGNHRMGGPQKAVPQKTSQVVWGQTPLQGGPSTSGSGPPNWARPGQAPSDVHRVRQNASEAAVQSSVGFSWGPPVVTSQLTSADARRRQPPDSHVVENAKAVKEVVRNTASDGGGNVWGSGSITAASVLKGGSVSRSETPPQPVLVASSFPSLSAGVPKPQNPARKPGKRPRTPAGKVNRNGGLGPPSASASPSVTPQNSRPGTPLVENGSEERTLERDVSGSGGLEFPSGTAKTAAGVGIGVGVNAHFGTHMPVPAAAFAGVSTGLNGSPALDTVLGANAGGRKEDGAAALNLLTSKHGRSLSEDVLRGFEGLRSEGGSANGLHRPTSSGGVQASTSRLFSGGYGLHRSLSSRASSVASEDSGGSGSPARGGGFGQSVYGAALGGGTVSGGNGWSVGAASSRQYSEGWTPEALAKARAIIAAARLAQVGPPSAPPPIHAWPAHPELQSTGAPLSVSQPAPPSSDPLFSAKSDDSLLRQLAEVGGPLARQLSGLAVSDVSENVGSGGLFAMGGPRQGGFVGGDGGGEKARVPRSQGGSLSRSSSRQNSLERVVESSVLHLVRECESGAETSGEILPDNPWQAPQLYRSVGGTVKPSNPTGFDTAPGLSTNAFQGGSVWNDPFGSGAAFGTPSDQGLGLGGLRTAGFNGTGYSSFLGTGVSGSAPAVPAAIQEAFNRPIPPANPAPNLAANPFKPGEIPAPFSFGSTKPPTGLANNSSPISPLGNLPPYPAPSFFGAPNQQQPFGSPPFAASAPPHGMATSPSSFKSAHSFFDQDFSSSRIPHPDASIQQLPLPASHSPLFSSAGVNSAEMPILPSPPLVFSPPGGNDLQFLGGSGPPHQFSTNPAPSLSLNFDDPGPRGPTRASANRRSGSRFFKNVKDDSGGGGGSGGILGNGPPSILGMPEQPLPGSPSALRKMRDVGGGGANSSSPKSGSPRSPRTPKGTASPVVNISAAQAAAAAAQTGLQLGSSHLGAVHSEHSAARSPKAKSHRAQEYTAAHNGQARRKPMGEGSKQVPTVHQLERGAPNGLGGSGISRA